MKKIISLLLALVMLLPLTACEKENKEENKGSSLGSDPVYIEISVENYGKIRAELYPDVAPITVENFVNLVNDNFYSGIIFHRVIKGFMIQGGDPDGTGGGGSKETIKGEFASNGVENNLKHERGVLSMARTTAPNSASSQFFICHQTASHLDGDYAAFGRVTAGMAVVDAIANTQTGANDKPVNDIKMEYIKVVDSPKIDPVKAEITVAGHGKMALELYPDVAPQTVANFTALAEEGFYDGLTFHRIIKDFMIQGGDPEGTGLGGSDKAILGEFTANGIENSLSHKRGVISMARTNDPNSASSQFFICHVDYPSLDGGYAAFGQVTEGLEVLDSIAGVATGEGDMPLESVIIESVKIVK